MKKTYRQAWQAEKARMQDAPPRHSEEDILAMLTKKKPRRKTVPLWLTSAAASVAILIGVAYLLWLRPDTNLSGLPTVAELHPTTSVSVPVKPAITTTTLSSTPLSTPTVARRQPQTSTIAQMLVAEISNASSPILDTSSLMPDILSVSPSARTGENRAVAATPTEQLQSFHETDIMSSIDRQKTPKDLPTKTSFSQSSVMTGHPHIGLSAGVMFLPESTSRPTFGLVITTESKSKSAVCSNTQGGLSFILSQPENLISVHYGYGLSYYPASSLALRLNVGAFLLFGDFDIGMRLSAEAAYSITDHLSLSAGYQFYMPGIVSGDSRHTALLSVNFIL